MPSCPKCGKPVAPDLLRCPDDGAMIIETTAAHGTPPALVELPPPLHLPITLCGRYELTHRLGGGGMSVVYRGTDLQLGRAVAVKVICPHLRNTPSFDGRFHREAQILSRLTDPHIVSIHDFGIDAAAGPFLVMPLLEGVSLRDFISREGRVSVTLAVAVALQLFEALYHAHERGVIHRDLKPDNLFLVDQDGIRRTLRVLDFGIARIVEGESAVRPGYTGPGALLGTPRYMAPEVFDGKPADARTDLYSAGLVLFELLAGEMPQLFGKRLRDLRPDVPPELESLIEQCLKPDPDDRPLSAVEGFATLHDLSKDRGSVTLTPSAIAQLSARFRAEALAKLSPSPLEQPPRRPRRRWVWWAVGVAAVIAAAAVWRGS